MAASAQTPGLIGVWKADLQKSHIPGPPGMAVTQYLMTFEPATGRRGEKLIKQTIGVWMEKRGLEKSELTFAENGEPWITAYEGVPARATASWQGDTLSLKTEVAGTPRVITSTYRVSDNGQTLTVDTEITGGPFPQHSNVVLGKQAQSAASPLLAPEPKAGEHFKNVKTAEMKNLPVSEFIDDMHYFAWSLGKDCEFCHVRNDFASDDKKEKRTARTMIQMVASIDTNNFKGRPEVRCFTCHEQHPHPLRYPLFPGETAQEESHQPPANAAGAAPRQQ
jgi:hypothetical protein